MWWRKEAGISIELNLFRDDAPSRRAINSERYISASTEKRGRTIVPIYLTSTDLFQPP